MGETNTPSDRRAGLKAALAGALDRAGDELARFGEDIFDHPELGYREERTATVVAEELRRLGLQPEEGLALTGVKARLRGARPGPTICVLGELDALPVAEHARADPSTGAAHACGHNAQLTHLVGVARALVETDALRDLAGDVVFFAVPAEEYVDLEWRSEQARAGKLEFYGGKTELLRLGAFDDVDMAVIVHAVARPGTRQLGMGWTYNGLVAKRVRFVGRAAHAGAAPHQGINALNAASLAIQAIHAQRETFRDEDQVRVHPILTHGGTTINVVPADVRLETFVRGATNEAIVDAEAKVDRALRAGAMAVGATVEIETLPGYMPLAVHEELGALFRENAQALVGVDEWSEVRSIAASTDAGDLSHVMPVLHPSHGGCEGSNHGADFKISDFTTAYITPAKAMAWTLVDLLADDAARARKVLADFRPQFTRDELVAHARGLTRHERTGY
jgi:amidohydrolase